MGAKIKQLLRLDVGCGENKEKGWVGLDRRSLPGIEFVQEVEETPWNIPDNSCALIRMVHLWEHLRPWKTLEVMDEMWRIMAPEGQLQLTLPYGWSHGFVQDPTHCNPANETTWQYFDPSFSALYKIYNPKPWKLVNCQYQVQGNMLAVLEPRKDGDPNPIEITPERTEAVTTKLTPEDIFKAFHVAQYEYRDRKLARGEKWLPVYSGMEIDKNPYDLWRYLEMMQTVKPNRVVECGTANGASALYFLDLMYPGGKVVTVDIDDGTAKYETNPMRANPGKRPKRNGITYLLGSSTDVEVAVKIGKAVFANISRDSKLQAKVMVVLDSYHMKEHVLKELKMYSPLVSVGQYLVVEDTNINGHPVYPEYGPGPYEALLDWVPPGDMKFEEDKELRDKYPFSANTWLRRVK